ncbi:MAG: PepSY domain-containing protein, partial [Giesbergeria sp.]
YMPSGIAAAYRTDKGVDSTTYFADMQGEKPERRARRGAEDTSEPLPLIALQPIMDAASARWDGGRIGRLQARRDAQGRVVVAVTRHDGDRLQYQPPRMLFDGTTGQALEQADPTSPAIQTYGVMYGLHIARFAGPGMRWVLFGFGVLGSLMIATGMVLWTVKRSVQGKTRAQARLKASCGEHTAPSALIHAPVHVPFGERLVAGLNIATLAGLPLACGMYLAANRLLPLEMAGRADAELAWFFSAWGVALLWALASTVVRSHGWGWTVTMAAAGAVWLALPVVNALTTHTHLGISLPAGEWTWASMDLSFLATGTLLSWLAWRVRPGRVAKRKPRTRHKHHAHPAASKEAPTAQIPTSTPTPTTSLPRQNGAMAASNATSGA